MAFFAGDVLEGIGGIIHAHRAEAFLMRKELVRRYGIQVDVVQELRALLNQHAQLMSILYHSKLPEVRDYKETVQACLALLHAGVNRPEEEDRCWCARDGSPRQWQAFSQQDREGRMCRRAGLVGREDESMVDHTVGGQG